jgi:hypothetical protein
LFAPKQGRFVVEGLIVNSGLVMMLLPGHSGRCDRSLPDMERLVRSPKTRGKVAIVLAILICLIQPSQVFADEIPTRLSGLSSAGLGNSQILSNGGVLNAGNGELTSIPSFAFLFLPDVNNQGHTLVLDGETKNVGGFDNGSVTAGQLVVLNGGRLNASGLFNNGQRGSVVTVTGAGTTITSSGLFNAGQVTVGAGATFDSSAGMFYNLNNGTLAAGSFYFGGALIAGDPMVPTNPPGVPPGAISVIGAGASVVRDGAGYAFSVSAASMFDAQGNDLLQGINEIAGTVSLGDSGGASPEFDLSPSSGALTVDKGGNLNVGRLPSGSASFGSPVVTLGFGFLSGGADLVNNGNVTISGPAVNDQFYGSSLFVGGNITNNASGTILLQGAGAYLSQNQLTNFGTIRIDNGSTLDATGGLTNIDTNGNLTGGKFSIGGTLLVQTPIKSLGSNTAVTLDGVNAQLLQNAFGSANPMAGLAQNDGSLSLSNGAFLRIQPATLTNTGSITMDGVNANSFQIKGNFFNAGAETRLAAGGFSTAPGVVNIMDAAPFGRDVMAISGSIVNDGTIFIGAGNYLVAGSSGLDQRGDPAGDGTYVQHAGGTTRVSGTLVAGSVDIGAGSLLTGTGEIDGSVTNEGTINPGGDSTPGNLVITGDYSQSAQASCCSISPGTGPPERARGVGTR